jgi:putative zinc finger/helix-turn-helix YgiT family protein
MSEKLPPPVGRDRPFPWRCVECREKEVYPLATDYTTTIKHDGRPYTIEVRNLAIPTCRKCGQQVFTSAEDERIRDALRAHVGLLTSQEIRAHRVKLGLGQQELAEPLGIAKETVSRWESGAIQSRAMDNLLRLYFESEEVRRLLRERFAPDPPKPANRIRGRLRIDAVRYASVTFALHAGTESSN